MTDPETFKIITNATFIALALLAIALSIVLILNRQGKTPKIK